MARASRSSFSVTRGEPQLVAPARPTPREKKLLSDIDDQEGLKFHVPLVFFYRTRCLMGGRGTGKGKDPAMVIKEALGEALVYYYPFAGRLVDVGDGKLAVDCTGEGLLFVEADADTTIDHLGDAILPPCPCLEELLYDVPGSTGILGSPLLSIQVTRLKCEGFVLALRFKHTMCDSMGLVQFLNAVSELARGGGAQAPSLLPVWDRDILNAPHPPRITFIHHEFEEAYKTKSTLGLIDDNNSIVHRHVFFAPKDITALKSWILRTHGPCTTYEALAACVWRCRTAAFGLHPDEVVRFSSTVNARGRPGGLEIPPGYYGNAFAYPAVVATAGEVCGNPLGYAVGLVKKGKKVEMIGEYIKSMAALMVSKGRPLYTPEGLFIVSDNTRVGYQELDFGWGKPLYGGIAEAVFLITFFMRFRNSEGEEGVVVPVCLPPPVMERFEEEVKKMINISTAAQEKY